jgi:hypothetical protein
VAAKLQKFDLRCKSAQKQAAEPQTTFYTVVAAAKAILRFYNRYTKSAKTKIKTE